MSRINRRTFLSLAPGALAASCARGRAAGRDRRMIVLGIDGMDHGLMLRMIGQGKLPNFKRLVEAGGFQALGTTTPPQSPVAWSDFITGMDAGGHGIFDFLRHDSRTMAVALSTSAMAPGSTLLGLPLWGGGPVNLRDGPAFWSYLEQAGVDSTLHRVPANFPPVGEGARSFSGLGTPDLRGSSGTFSYFTDDPPADADAYTGGEVVAVASRDGRIETRLAGPPEGQALVQVPLTVFLDPERPLARIDLGGERIVLAEGEWSRWARVSFPLLGGLASASGIVRFFLKQVRPHFRLYASPVNIDPGRPALPIAAPSRAIRAQERLFGPFYTQGMPEDTKALQWGVLDDGQFLDQVQHVLAENCRLLEYELERFRGRPGFLFFYFSTLDQGSHALWRTLDDRHPAHRKDFPPRVAGSLPALYERMDAVLGRVLREVDERTLLVVMSDHGFAPFHRAAHLNNWLLREGFLALIDPRHVEGATLARDVDWRRTRAYAIGFNGIYLNRFGREASGVVTEADAPALIEELKRRLLLWEDGERGNRKVVATVEAGTDIYHGPHIGPDVVVGYARPYRASWETPLGELGPALIQDNTGTWSGDHMCAARQVPGILVSNRPFPARGPELKDLPATILDYFGLPTPAHMRGRSLFQERG